MWADRGQPQDFLVTATPGAGKTTFALRHAADLLARKVVQRVIIVVPTDHLRSQWAEAAAAFDLAVDPTLSNDVGPVAEDFVGYVCTYAQVAAKPALHMRRTELRRTLVILDEIHHAGDGLSWGEAVSEAFYSAKYRLGLTGTPFRTSAGEKIPFVRYEDDTDGAQRSVADFTYGYRHALADRVVRPVLFAAYSGVARWRNSAGETITASLSEPSTKDVEMTAWRTALNPAGQWIPHVIAAADHRLDEIRGAGMPDAGAMILASDQEHARAYAQIIERVTGTRPTVVLSEDSKASSRIEQFAASTDRWLVAVRMVSEGVDVPRLAVGVWATSYRTPLFFAQAVGRFVRARRAGETATIFLPAVRPLLTLAAEMEAERDHVLAAPAAPDELLDVVQPELPENASDALGFEALEAEAEFAHVLFGGRALTGEERPEGAFVSEEDQDFLGLPGLLDPGQTAVLLKQREVHLRRISKDSRTGEQTPAQVQQAHKQAASLRREVNSLVSRIAARTGKPHAQVHAGLRKAVPGPASASASVEQLQARRDHLLSLL
jgi:superfamily II DNA or RNA helicase